MQRNTPSILVTFVYWQGDIARRLADSLSAAARHGCRARVLVCDAEVAFTGGVGIADEWVGDARAETEWRNTHLPIRGPAVAGLLAGFIDNWADQNDGFDPRFEPAVDPTPAGSSTCAVVRNTAETGASDMWRLMLGLTSCADRPIRITTACFNPDDQVCTALSDPVERGVEVSILDLANPPTSDSSRSPASRRTPHCWRLASTSAPTMFR